MSHVWDVKCCVTSQCAAARRSTETGLCHQGGGGKGHEDKNPAPRRQEPPPPQAFFQLCDEEDPEWGRGRTSSGDFVFAPVPVLNAPVPPIADLFLEFEQCWDLLPAIAEWLIEVPKITLHGMVLQPREPQLVEQLVAVPTLSVEDCRVISEERVQQRHSHILIPVVEGLVEVPRKLSRRNPPGTLSKVKVTVEQIADILVASKSNENVLTDGSCAVSSTDFLYERPHADDGFFVLFTDIKFAKVLDTGSLCDGARS